MYVVLKKQNNPLQMTTKHKNKQTNPQQWKTKQSKIQKKSQPPKKDGISKHEKMNFYTQAKKEWKTQSTNYMPKQAFFLGTKNHYWCTLPSNHTAEATGGQRDALTVQRLSNDSWGTRATSAIGKIYSEAAISSRSKLAAGKIGGNTDITCPVLCISALQHFHDQPC